MDEINRYNHRQVHSTTKEIPSVGLANARATGNTLFQPLVLPKPYTSPPKVLGLSAKDVFCLHETRVVNGYRRISLFRHDIAVPNVPLHEQVDVHLIPDSTSQTVTIQVWASARHRRPRPKARS
jgi:hypothetical protein